MCFKEKHCSYFHPMTQFQPASKLVWAYSRRLSWIKLSRQAQIWVNAVFHFLSASYLFEPVLLLRNLYAGDLAHSEHELGQHRYVFLIAGGGIKIKHPVSDSNVVVKSTLCELANVGMLIKILFSKLHLANCEFVPLLFRISQEQETGHNSAPFSFWSPSQALSCRAPEFLL